MKKDTSNNEEVTEAVDDDGEEPKARKVKKDRITTINANRRDGIEGTVKVTINVDKIKTRVMVTAKKATTEMAKDIRGATQDNSRVDSGKTRGSYNYRSRYRMREKRAISWIGSKSMNAVYEEFGTGEFAENKDGRKGGWVYYNEKDGKFYFTYGKSPNKPLRRAVSEKKDNLADITARLFKEEFKDGGY